MPIYQYKCTQCQHSMEALQKMSDVPLVNCPKCEQATLKKQVTAAAFKLRGTGWYETDFKNSGKPSTPAKSSDSPTTAAAQPNKETSPASAAAE